jgi:hypothetical protein
MKQSASQTMWDQVMLALSALSEAARAAGDDRTMYAANRAWRELDRAGRPTAQKESRQ